MDFTANFKSNIGDQAAKDAAEVRRLKEELGGLKEPVAPAGLGDAGKASANESAAAKKAVDDSIALRERQKDYAIRAARAEELGRAKAADETAKRLDLAAKARAKSEADSPARKAGGMALGAGKAAAAAAIAAIGISGLSSLNQLALGYQGVAKLNMMMARTSLQARALFSKVDSGPYLRGMDRLLTGIFGKGQVGATALGGILTRSFNTAFSVFEKAQPLISAFIDGLILGALYTENAYLKVRVALLPVTDVLEDMLASQEAINAAAQIGVGFFGGITGAIRFASAAIGEMLTKAAAFVALKRGTKVANVLASLGVGGDGQSADTRDGYASPKDRKAAIADRERLMAADDAARAGVDAGAAYSAGMVRGAADGAAAVKAAGKGLVGALDKGVREAGEIKSPSRLARRTARWFPEGAALGITDGASQVQAAAERSMVPDLSGFAGTMGGGAVGGAKVEIHQTNHFAAGQDVSAALDAANQRLIRDLAITLGIPVTAS